MELVPIEIYELINYILKECKTSEDIINTGIYNHLGNDIIDELVNNFSFEELRGMVRRFEYVTFWSLIQTDIYKDECKILNEAIDYFLAKYLPVSTDINYIMYAHLHIPGKIVKLSRKAIEDAIEAGFQRWTIVSSPAYSAYWFDIKFDYYSYANNWRIPRITVDGSRVLESREKIIWR